MQFYTTLNVMPKHYIPRTERELGDFGEWISRFLPSMVYWLASNLTRNKNTESSHRRLTQGQDWKSWIAALFVLISSTSPFFIIIMLKHCHIFSHTYRHHVLHPRKPEDGIILHLVFWHETEHKCSETTHYHQITKLVFHHYDHHHRCHTTWR
jgi:hypothetical protein